MGASTPSQHETTVVSQRTTSDDKQTKPMSAQYQKRKENATVLAQSYTKTKRAQEIICMTLSTIFLGLTASNVYEVLRWDQLWIVVIAFFFAMLLGDLLSGILHWTADTWGSFDTPFVGQTFIRSFREHHLDPFRITVHDTIETNGDNALIVLLPLAALAFADLRVGNATDLFVVSFASCLALWAALTNQFHKWAHMVKPPKVIAFLQDIRFILPRKEHQVHHHNPFDRYYCIANGWLNAPLASIAFWKRLELIITAITGSVPRKDDAFWTLQTK
eukprot:TRINITY_DN16737_c0_g1_i1.p1 TRINITY_DN16737_c0_g1~~TRINITY_DN16737_c0_g1_i1.p1  ORF type:complete len:275 (-),score=29.71 TRINITY_DN16737_c0_g1_i1:45-869(-)